MSESHSHSYAAANFNTAFAIGIALNLGFVLIEGFYGWKINSLALLADAGHNHSDVAGLLLAWGGALAGRLRSNAQHTYGRKRASILAAFITALLLLVAMGLLAREALHRLQRTSGGKHHAPRLPCLRYYKPRPRRASARCTGLRALPGDVDGR